MSDFLLSKWLLRILYHKISDFAIETKKTTEINFQIGQTNQSIETVILEKAIRLLQAAAFNAYHYKKILRMIRILHRNKINRVR